MKLVGIRPPDSLPRQLPRPHKVVPFHSGALPASRFRSASPRTRANSSEIAARGRIQLAPISAQDKSLPPFGQNSECAGY